MCFLKIEQLVLAARLVPRDGKRGMANVLFAAVMFPVLCFAANAALGWWFVYQDFRVRSEEPLCVRVGTRGIFYSWEGHNPPCGDWARMWRSGNFLPKLMWDFCIPLSLHGVATECWAAKGGEGGLARPQPS